jgi:hypothetical protein
VTMRRESGPQGLVVPQSAGSDEMALTLPCRPTRDDPDLAGIIVRSMIISSIMDGDLQGQ